MNHIVKIQKCLGEKGLDAMLITSPVNRRYATGFPSSAGIGLITPEEAYFYTDSRYIEAARSAISGALVEMTDINNSYVDKINTVIAARKIKELGVEDETLSYAEYLKYGSKLKASLLPAQEALSSLRMLKDESEIGKLLKAQRLAEKAYEQVLGIIKVGMTEKEIAAELIYRMLLLGAENISFEPIVVTGAKTSLPHGVPGDEVVRAGSFITMDFGCILDGYCSDMTRTVAVGQVSDEMKRVYDIVLTAQLAGIAEAKAGVTGAQVDGAARAIIAAEGYADCFGHGFGHGLGMEVHESPTASPSGKTPLPERSVISAEPGIYIPGKFGVRIEDVIVIREGGNDNLTAAPKELVIL